MAKKLIAALLLLVAHHSSFAAPLDGLTKVGKGKMEWLFLELYQASLYTQDGRYVAQQYPLALEITYSRDISADDLIEATKGEWQKQGVTNADIERHSALLKSVWVNVKKGDTLLLVAKDGNKGEFFHNGKPLGVVEQTGIMHAFLGIWLRSDTSEPLLRAQLLGDVSCDC